MSYLVNLHPNAVHLEMARAMTTKSNCFYFSQTISCYLVGSTTDWWSNSPFSLKIAFLTDSNNRISLRVLSPSFCPSFSRQAPFPERWSDVGIALQMPSSMMHFNTKGNWEILLKSVPLATTSKISDTLLPAQIFICRDVGGADARPWKVLQAPTKPLPLFSFRGSVTILLSWCLEHMHWPLLDFSVGLCQSLALTSHLDVPTTELGGIGGGAVSC